MPGTLRKRRSSGLSAAFVASVTEPGKYYDGKGVGLFLRVDEDGGKYWIQRSSYGGKSHDIGLGSYPVVTLAMAREQALENKRMIRSGKDPLLEKRKSQTATSFEAAMDRYLEVKSSEFRNDKHRKQWRATLTTYALPKIGHLSVAAITVQDVLRVLEPIWLEKTETAKRLRGRIEKILDWATVSQFREGENPARLKGNLSELLPKAAKVAKTQHFPALALKDARRWWLELTKRQGASAQALQFLCMTTARSGEVRGMTWDEVDLEGALWTIPSERMKAGSEHRVPLTDEAVALLNAMPRLARSPYVFFAKQGGMLSDMTLSAVMRRMQESEVEAGRPGYLDERSGRAAVPHGLRSTFRDWAAEQGYDHILAELALAHRVGSDVERAYRRTDMLSRRRDMLKDWHKFLAGDLVQT
nr:site-specific integrase [Boseongicola sp. H5]